MRIPWKGLAVAVSLAAASSALQVDAQVRTDASLGHPPRVLTGPQFVIPESLGSLRGVNLFHSFSVFNIANGESATFATTTAGIRNIISRVTGGEPSVINGVLSVAAAAGAPSLYFINPAGIVFGGGASVDVPGGFHATTADYLRFPDGVFYANAASTSTLSSAPPEAFGFLGTSRATVAVSGAARLVAGTLQPFSLVAGDVEIDGGLVTSRGGPISIVAVGQRAVEIAPGAPLPALEGSVRIVNGGQVYAPAIAEQAGGPITIAAGSVALASGGRIATVTRSAGDAGAIRVEAEDIVIDGSGTPAIRRLSEAPGILTGIVSWSTGPYATVEGSPGNIDIVARNSLRVLNGGTITSTTNSLGDAGTVNVHARSIVVDGALDEDLPSSINARADIDADGRTGFLNVTATDRITLSNGGELSILNDGFLVDFTGRDRTLMTVAAPEIFLTSGARITADSQGDAGASDIRVAFGSRLSMVDSTITSSSLFGANSGSIVIEGPGAIYLANSRITTSIPTYEGNGGDIRISAQALAMATGFIQANTADASGRASAGNVLIDVQSLVPTASTLFAGGIVPLEFQPGRYGFNVIQAAAPRGLSGTVTITTPVLDVSSGLVQLGARVIEPGALARTLCQSTGESSLVQAGRGGLPPDSRGLLRAEPPEAAIPHAQDSWDRAGRFARIGCAW